MARNITERESPSRFSFSTVLSLAIAFAVGFLVSRTFTASGPRNTSHEGSLDEVPRNESKSIVAPAQNDTAFSCAEEWRRPRVEELGPGEDHHWDGAHILFEPDDYVNETDWFRPEPICQETCCAQQYLLRSRKEARSLISEITMKEVSELRFGRLDWGKWPKNGEIGEYYSSVLTEKIAPCVQYGTSIKVERADTYYFFETFHETIGQPYVLISGGGHGGDWSTPTADEKKYLDEPKLLRWFHIHPLLNHGKITPFPLGVNMYSSARVDIERILAARNYTNPFEMRSRKCYSEFKADDGIDTLTSFNIESNPDERSLAWKLLCGSKPNKEEQKGYSRHPDEAPFAKCNYGKADGLVRLLKEMDEVIFALSPKGMGIDCHRPWELLALGVIPVMVRYAPFDELFDNLPVLMLDEWNMTSEEFRTKQKSYLELSQFQNARFVGYEKLFGEYWRRRVLEAGGRNPDTMQDPITGEKFHLLWRYWEK